MPGASRATQQQQYDAMAEGAKSSTSSRYSSSQRSESSRASPLKRLAELEVAERNPICERPMHLPLLPTELREMVLQIRRRYSSRGVVPRSLAAEIARRAAQSQNTTFAEFELDDEDLMYYDDCDDEGNDGSVGEKDVRGENPGMCRSSGSDGEAANRTARFGRLSLHQVLDVYRDALDC